MKDVNRDIDKLKQTLTITIVDENGSRQFTMAKIAQRFVGYISLFVLVAIVGGYFFMSSFVNQLDTINIAKQETYREFQSIYEQNTFLQDDIQNKTEELQAMKDKVDDLEKMMNINSFDNRKNKIQDFDLHSLAKAQKDTILQIIPNGNPLKIFEMKQKTKRNVRDYNLIDTQYRVTQNAGNMGYDYYTSKSEPVIATADGIVESTRDGNQKYGYGNIVRISHVLGFSSAYTNLGKINVQKGEFVSKGDVIGYTTASPGRNNISLYYEIRFLSEGLDTLSFIDWDKDNFRSIFDAEQNSNIDLKSLMWALNDIVKLNDMSSHFAFVDMDESIDKEFNKTKQFNAYNLFDTIQK